MKHLLVISLFLFVLPNDLFCQPPNPNCLPFSPCWCEQNPYNPQCVKVKVSINTHIWVLAISGILLGCYHIKRNKNSNG